MEKKRAYSVTDVKKLSRSSHTLGELKEYLTANFSNDWTLGIESTKTLYIKSKKMRGISISINIDYDLVQNVKLDYRLISLEKMGVNKPNNRVLKPEELAIINKTINLIRKYLS